MSGANLPAGSAAKKMDPPAEVNVQLPALGQAVYNSRKEDYLNSKKAREFKESLANPNRPKKVFKSSELSQYQIATIFGKIIETFPKTVRRQQFSTCNNEEATLLQRADWDFATLLNLDTYSVLEKMLNWMNITDSIEDVKDVLSKDQTWNDVLLSGLVNPICEHVLSKLPKLPSLGITEGARFFEQLEILCTEVTGIENGSATPHLARKLLTDFRQYAKQMAEALYARYYFKQETPAVKKGKQTKNAQKTSRKEFHGTSTESANPEAVEMADIESDDDDEKEPAYKRRKKSFAHQHEEVPVSSHQSQDINSELHTLLVFLWTKMMKEIIPESGKLEYLVNGSAKTNFLFHCDYIKYNLHCHPDGLLQYDTRDGSSDDPERYVPFFVLECKTVVGTGWYNKGADPQDFDVPVTAMSEWICETTASESESKEPKSIVAQTSEAKPSDMPSPGQNLRSPIKGKLQELRSPGKKGESRSNMMTEGMKIARNLMSSRLDKFRTQHAVELCTALKQAQSKKVRNRTYGFYVSDHLVFPTVLEASLIGEDDQVSTHKRKEILRKCIQSNRISGIQSDDDDGETGKSTESAMKAMKYKCSRSPLPLNLFCPSHLSAIAHYIRYLSIRHIKDTLGIAD